jgi:hypothetical protein
MERFEVLTAVKMPVSMFWLLETHNRQNPTVSVPIYLFCGIVPNQGHCYLAKRPVNPQIILVDPKFNICFE